MSQGGEGSPAVSRAPLSHTLKLGGESACPGNSQGLGHRLGSGGGWGCCSNPRRLLWDTLDGLEGPESVKRGFGSQCLLPPSLPLFSGSYGVYLRCEGGTESQDGGTSVMEERVQRR